MVLLDLQKAFDTVDYDILCNKLQAMGIHIDSVIWFKSYLSDRQQIEASFASGNLWLNVDFIRSQIADGKYTGMVLLDLQKAFDTVDYDILCNKLQAMGIHIDSVIWFKSYLSDRQQIVSVNQVESMTHEYIMRRATG
ncbi:uncharacterized protein [Amphiura filiformis]|uniref:uncharacterized protein n=1 Tax=Amphiura filiformis TaxID=82378 RepID=UPI003B213DFA